MGAGAASAELTGKMLGRFLSPRFKQRLAGRGDARTVAPIWVDADDRVFVYRLLEN